LVVLSSLGRTVLSWSYCPLLVVLSSLGRTVLSWTFAGILG